MFHTKNILRVGNINRYLHFKSKFRAAKTTQIKNYTSDTERHTHFGFETVKENEKTQKVHELFTNVAHKYDIVNDAMSGGIHRIWKDIFIDRLGPCLNTKLLDVAGGTGDIAFRYINYLLNLPNVSREQLLSSESNVTIIDINPTMLKEGQRKAENLKLPKELINWKVENAEELSFNDNEFTAYTIAFGLRNVTHIDKALREAYRILKPGGRFMCLEFSRLDNDLAQWAYDQYSFKLIPVIGQLISGHWEAYQYLVESIRKFPAQKEFCHMIEEAGFRNVTYENLSMGIVAIHSGFKI